MEKKKKLDMLKTPYLSRLVEELNRLGVQREDLVSIYPPGDGIETNYIAIFYC